MPEKPGLRSESKQSGSWRVEFPARVPGRISSSLFCSLSLSTMVLLRQASLLRGRSLRVPAHYKPALWSVRSVKTLQKFKLADIGEGITECEVIKWCASSPSPPTRGL